MIKVGSYNIQKSIGLDARRRPERTLHVIKELDCDILALQEADKRFGERESTLNVETLHATTNYKTVPVVEGGKSLGWHGNAILVRNSVEILSTRRLFLPQLEPRGAVTADLKVGQHTFRFVATHLSLFGHFRKKQIRSLLTQLDSDQTKLPTILVGDLNEWRNTSKSMKILEETHRVTTLGRSFPSALPLGRLDRIVTTKDVKILQSGVHQTSTARIASDHLPVWANLTSRTHLTATDENSDSKQSIN